MQRLGTSLVSVGAGSSVYGYAARRSFGSAAGAGGISKVGVVGLGLMGHGIAQISAAAGFKVVAYETEQKALDGGYGRIQKSIEKLASKQVEKGKVDQAGADKLVAATLGNITKTLKKEDLADCDLVIEAIIENIDVKRKLYSELGKIVKPSGILASNTSSLSITTIAEASGRPNLTIGLHYFNPVQLMGLVEVVRTDQTDPQAFQAAHDFVKKTGKSPVSCKDTPGFVVNRLLVPYLVQSLLLLERGDATKEDIDTAMRLGAGHPMGPITLADYVGLDTTLYILEGWKRDYPNEPAFIVPEILKQKVKEGKFGRKSGEGFYKWQGDKVIA